MYKLFQQIMGKTFSDLYYAMASMDDISVVSASGDENIKHLEVFCRTQSYDFHFQMGKSMFLLPRINCLGTIINKNS